MEFPASNVELGLESPSSNDELSLEFPSSDATLLSSSPPVPVASFGTVLTKFMARGGIKLGAVATAVVCKTLGVWEDPGAPGIESSPMKNSFVFVVAVSSCLAGVFAAFARLRG